MVLQSRFRLFQFGYCGKTLKNAGSSNKTINAPGLKYFYGTDLEELAVTKGWILNSGIDEDCPC